ncbi:hypothetical protein JOM56_007088 [Amanita muscaria]
MQAIPGIMMVGAFPIFYKIAVAADLDDRCVWFGQYPTTHTVVYRHTPRVPRRRSDGMRPLDSRKLVLVKSLGTKIRGIFLIATRSYPRYTVLRS